MKVIPISTFSAALRQLFKVSNLKFFELQNFIYFFFVCLFVCLDTLLSSLKHASLQLASGASLRFAFYARPRAPFPVG